MEKKRINKKKEKNSSEKMIPFWTKVCSEEISKYHEISNSSTLIMKYRMRAWKISRFGFQAIASNPDSKCATVLTRSTCPNRWAGRPKFVWTAESDINSLTFIIRIASLRITKLLEIYIRKLPGHNHQYEKLHGWQTNLFVVILFNFVSEWTNVNLGILL